MPGTKSGRQCGGYRDISTLLFVNYTHRDSRQSIDKSNSSGPLTTSKALIRKPSQMLPPEVGFRIQIPQTIRQDRDHLAKGYFQSQYIGLGYFTFLPGLSKQGRIEPILERALDAAGAIGLAHIYHPQDTTDARRQYVRALQLTNAALRNPRTVSSIQTLAAVMLLGMYEVGLPLSLAVIYQTS